MASISEKAISILAGNLNSGRSYLITAVQEEFSVGNGSGSTDLDWKPSKKRAKNRPKQASKIEGGKSDKRAESSRYFLFNDLENCCCQVKFMFSKKATKIDEIFNVDLTVTTYCQIDGEDFANFCVLLRKREL